MEQVLRCIPSLMGLISSATSSVQSDYNPVSIDIPPPPPAYDFLPYPPYPHPFPLPLPPPYPYLLHPNYLQTFLALHLLQGPSLWSPTYNPTYPDIGQHVLSTLPLLNSTASLDPVPAAVSYGLLAGTMLDSRDDCWEGASPDLDPVPAVSYGLLPGTAVDSREDCWEGATPELDPVPTVCYGLPPGTMLDSREDCHKGASPLASESVISPFDRIVHP
jgi:hypothetical protein